MVIAMSPNGIKTTFLLGFLTALFLYFGQAFGGQTGLGIAFLLSVLMNLGSYWFADKIILKLYNAKEVVIPDDHLLLYGTVAYLTERAEMIKPRMYIIDQPSPNAFATGRNPENAAIVVTTGLLKILNKEELAGVISHELAHILHRDTLTATIAATIGGAISILANFLQWVFVLGMGKRPENSRNPVAMFLMSMLAPFIALLIQLAISRTREFAADEKAAEICGNALWLAHALYKIERNKANYQIDETEQNPATAHMFIINPLHNRQWQNLFATHPPTGERIRRLEALA
jgi:heat shock protein HtpX